MRKNSDKMKVLIHDEDFTKHFQDALKLAAGNEEDLPTDELHLGLVIGIVCFLK